MSSTTNATWRIPGVFAGAMPVVALGRRRVELHQLESSVAVRSLHHRKLHPDALEPHDAVHPAAVDLSLALQLESELDGELSRGHEVVVHDADVLHPLDSRVFDGKEPDSGRGARRRKRPEAALISTTARPTRTPRNTNPHRHTYRPSSYFARDYYARLRDLTRLMLR